MSSSKAHVSVIGGGNAGHCQAFSLAHSGQPVCLWEHPDFPAIINNLRAADNTITSIENTDLSQEGSAGT